MGLCDFMMRKPNVGPETGPVEKHSVRLRLTLDEESLSSEWRHSCGAISTASAFFLTELSCILDL